MRPLGMVVDRHFVHDAMLQPRDLLSSAYRSPVGLSEHDWLAARIHIIEGTLAKHSAAIG
jgi:hypothetical protein